MAELNETSRHTDTFVFDQVQKQKSSIVRFVLDYIEDIHAEISDEELNGIRKKLYRMIDSLHVTILDE